MKRKGDFFAYSVMKSFFKKAFIVLGLIIAPLSGCKAGGGNSRYVKYGNDEVGWKTERLYTTTDGKNVKADNIRMEQGYEFFVQMSKKDIRYFEDVSPISPAMKEGMIEENIDNENTYVAVTDVYAFIVSIEKIDQSVFVSYAGKNSIVLPSRTPTEEEKRCLENIDSSKIIATGSIRLVTPKKNGGEWFTLVDFTVKETNCGREITELLIIDVDLPKVPPKGPTHTIHIYILIDIYIEIIIHVIPEDEPSTSEETSSQTSQSTPTSSSTDDGYIWEAMDYGYDVWCNRTDYYVGQDFSIDGLVVYQTYFVHKPDYSDSYSINIEIPHSRVKYEWCELVDDETIVGHYEFHEGPISFNEATTEPFRFWVYDDFYNEWLLLTPGSVAFFWANWHYPEDISDPDTQYGFVKSTAVMKTSYKVGEQLDLSGLKMYARYGDGRRVLLNRNQYSVDTTNLNMKEAGTYWITVSYGGMEEDIIISVRR